MNTFNKYFNNVVGEKINDLLGKGICSEILKNTIITPIFKSGDLVQSSNYRHILLLPVIG